MATIQPTTDRNSVNGALLVSFALGNADQGAAFAVPFAADITAHVTGTFGGATVLLNRGWVPAEWRVRARAASAAPAGCGDAFLPCRLRPLRLRATRAA